MVINLFSSIFKLSMAPMGKHLRIVSITHSAPEIRRKLLDIGLNPGSQIMLTKLAQGAAIISRGGNRCALSLSIANRIFVEPAELPHTGVANDNA